MKKIDSIIEMYPDESFLKADGFDDAILGVIELQRIGMHLLAYSKSMAINILINRENMTEEDAEEYYSYNIVGAYMGAKTPIWVDDVYDIPITEIRKEKLNKINECNLSK